MPRLSGRIVEKWTGAPVSGAVVNVNGAVVIADGAGNFSIETPHQTANIQVMHIGYTTLSESLPLLANNNDVEINLVPNVRAL